MDGNRDPGEAVRRHVKESYLRILDLRARGQVGNDPVRLEFSFRSGEKQCLIWLRDQLKKKTDLLLEYVESEEAFLLRAKTKPMALSFREVENLVAFLGSLSVQFGCIYDGWDLVV